MYHLFSNHDDGLGRKSPVADVKEIFQRWSKEVDDENVVQAFLAKVIDIGYAGCSCLAW